MPPWVASVPRLTTLCSRRAIDHFSSPLRCRHVRNTRPANLRFRAASTHVSPTAINYRPNIPPENKELYDVLSELSGKAEQYVNISRLQLALRGFAVDNAVTRVAVLGLSSQVGAQRLVRALLADPLAGEQGWEGELEKVGEEGAVLLRSGDENDAHPPSPLYKTLSVPSRILAAHNLEVLVSTLNVDVARTVISPADSSMDALLVPKLQATSARGLPVPYPVHKTLILGEGLDSAVAFGKFTADSTAAVDMVKVAIDLPPPAKEAEAIDGAVATSVNVDSGMQALNALRTSVQNATFYERSWFASNLPTISKWLTQNLEPAVSTVSIKPAHSALVSSILDNIETNLVRADAEYLALFTSASSSSAAQISAEMTSYVEAWAERGHEELRDSLDEAFTSKNWRRLAWWKLFWRVDDVGMVLEELLERRWLVDAEKDAVFLAGRMKQAGFPEIAPPVPVIEVVDEQLEATSQQDPAQPFPPPSNAQTDLSTEVHHSSLWQTILPTTRAALLTSTLVPLHALAQRLILTTLSTTSLSSALSALLYVSVDSFSVFEASAVAALGIVFSLRRMQKVWEGAREDWMKRVREEGRQALKGTERGVKGIVEGRARLGTGEGVDDSVKERRVVREVVGRVRSVLAKMEGR
ncbi:hypothetical protein K458DRAFT_365612 [Lentithecium fluviatile CBS 122367]|uniref:Mmc1 C-terminal domain-containing protein n=1 Tax=Lentithecium fluviatile CBS 122367 TaxID=1168545 RepID=A0A6G1J513_9PLEO|nr:hypothetical protein K458DRAFT_365612 [Lentithecium fluviatile CBS 122367]